jgi:membrane carboxypeptidase/penicillin-binding protein
VINVTNYIAGFFIRIIALMILFFKKSFRTKFKALKEKIASVNKEQIQLPQHLYVSIIEIEDRRYFYHMGVDMYSILRAIFKNLTTIRLEGASTIVQQLVRNITNEREIRIKRKIKEVLLASLINGAFSKNEILYAYITTYRFNNCTGILTFCQIEKYNIEELTINESAQIAARFKFPTINKSNYVKYLKRVRTIEIKTITN